MDELTVIKLILHFFKKTIEVIIVREEIRGPLTLFFFSIIIIPLKKKRKAENNNNNNNSRMTSVISCANAVDIY